MAQHPAPTHRDRLADVPEDVPERRLWSQMIGFASLMLLLQGGFHAIGGFVALLEQDHYQVPSTDLMVSVDYKVWGIAHMALGVGMCLAGTALFYRKAWARVVAIVVAMASAITNLGFLSAAPVWFSMMIVIDLLIIYSVTAHFDSSPDYDY